MAITNNLLKQVDIPVWEWARFAPSTVTATSATTVGENPGDRYIYYLQTSVLYRYDTVSDSWMQLASPNTNAATTVSLSYSNYSGYRGRVLSAGASTAVIPGIKNSILKDCTIRILSGAGAGQTRTITNITENGIQEHGVATSASGSAIGDSTKKWKINQWAGYQVAVVYGTGQTQRRKILYNDTNTLTVSDTNFQQLEPFNNTGFAGTSPYAAPTATAGSQAMYTIESSTITVDTPWTVQPDNTSKFLINSGGLWLISSASAAPFYTLQFYDIAADMWINKTAVQGILTGALGTDVTMEKMSNAGGAYITSTATSGTNRTLVDTTLNMVSDRYSNYQIRITSGTGAGQRRRIEGNTATTFIACRKWDVTPDATSTYEIWDDVHVAYIAGNGSSSMYQYHTEADLLSMGSVFDYGTARNMSVRLNGWEDIAVSTATRVTNGIGTINTTPVAAGTGYVVGEIVTLGTGSGGKVIVESINPGGSVTSVSILAVGSGYAVATAAQSATTGAGTGLTVAITALSGVVGKIVTAINHNIKIGQQITFAGAVEAAWNNTYTVVGCDALTSLEVVTTATATAAAASSQSSTVLVDSSALWDTNELVGKLAIITTNGTAPTSQIRKITANTANTLTLQSAITAAVNGTSRYIICDPGMFGRDEQSRIVGRSNEGYATGGSTTTLIDTTKSWIPNQWANYKVMINTSTGIGGEVVITSNTANTLTYATQSFTPNNLSKYIIQDTFGVCTAGSTTTLQDTSKNWTVNQWAGKRVKLMSGTGVGQEYTITSNTSNTLTFGLATAPGTDTAYTILGIPPRNAGIEMYHLFGLSDPTVKGKYMFVPRGGGSNTFDRYDITSETWDYGVTYKPQSETFTTGSMYAYDGVDTVYITKDATGRVYSLNLLTGVIENASTIPYGQGTALIGNRMELVTTVDGLKFLYMMRHSGTEMWRTLIYY